ncbi:Golgi transport complex subunit COG6 [Lachancea thermotolerans CBS 6340]|uniref:Conserved oligomeric Golgi complex subunit 6 n=1 Tax=Lachancea thermotolerans (strain ATCC 56472 / CBS 6340 / NRRL Y-8284) TaxID=559295 RepID=C5DMM3_LACTC|nr:KLTH0G10076p [Lachancea thermotolerans CBS 6340]CAR25034.1 KLTH0G10076p [Lachancea thermotolerans CBS 6340]
MDFLDYQTFALDEANAKDYDLPEPASRLPIKSQQSSKDLDKDFSMPRLANAELDAEGTENLQDKMQKYASLSLSALSLKRLPPQSSMENPVVSQGTSLGEKTLEQLVQNGEKTIDNTDALLSKRLSRILDAHHRNTLQCDTQLRRSFKVLEDNQDRLHFNSKTLVRPDFVGSLARNSLRSNLESELLKSHLMILDDIQPIVRRIKRLSEPVQNIHQMGDALLKQGEMAHDETKTYMDTVYILQNALLKHRLKKRILVMLRDKLTLNQVEEDALINSNVGPEFFEVMKKLMRLKETATYLLALPNPKAGTVLMEQTNAKIEKANKRIFNYLVDFLYDLQSASKTFGERAFSSNDKPLITFQQGMLYLSNDLPIFNEFIKRVVKARSQIVLDDFLSQFDVSSAKASRPIIISAHDPVRYLGDVLAHVHSLIVDEADFMDSMFKFQNWNIQDTPTSILQENREFLNGLSISLLNETFGPVENSIRIRLEQIIRFEDDPIINFEIYELLALYQMMFIKYGLRPDSNLILQLINLRNTSSSKILTGLTKILDDANITQNLEKELLPAEWLVKYLAKLCELLTKFEKSGSVKDSETLIDSNFLKEALACLITEKLPEYHKSKFPQARKEKEVKKHLLLSEINCIDLIKTRMLPYRETIFSKGDRHLVYENIDSHLQASTKSLIGLETKSLLEKLGLDLYSNLFNMIFPVESVQDELDYDMYLPVLENPIMQRDTIRSNVHIKLNDFLPILLSDIQDNLLFHIVSPKIADHISTECLSCLSKFYKVFRQVLLKLYPENHEDIDTILNFSEEEFDTLIGLN